jgi:hypothetical protein
MNNLLQKSNEVNLNLWMKVNETPKQNKSIQNTV